MEARGAPALHVVESGPADAPLVVLVHGSMDRSGGFAKVARRLQHHRRVLRYDRRGYGASLAVGGPFTVERHVADLAALLAGRRAVVVGHSFGGNVALGLADRHPDLVRALLVYEAPMSWEPWWPQRSAGGRAVAAARQGTTPEDAAEAFLRTMIGDSIWERLPGGTRAERRSEGHALVAELADLRAGAPYDPAHVVAPTLVAHGEHGRPHQVEGARVLASRLARAELVVLAGAGHGAHLSHPDAFAELVERTVAIADTSRP